MKNFFWPRTWRLLLLLLLPALGYAQPNSTHIYKIMNRATGQVLDAARPNYGGDYDSYYGVYTTNNTNSASQQWKFMASRSNGTGVYEIINRSSGQVLTVPYSSTGNSTFVVQNPRTGVVGGVQTNGWQLWRMQRLTSVSAVSYQIVVLATNLLLTDEPANYGRVTQGDPQLPGQIWDLVDISPNPTSNLDQGVYAITNVRSSQLLGTSTDWIYLDRVTQNPDAGIAAQEWTFMPSTTVPGYFHIVNRTNQRALEIGGAAQNQLYNQGRQANLWDNWRGPNQTWGVLDIYDGHLLTLAEARDGRPCILWNYHTNQCLEMGGGGSYPLQVGRIPNQWPYVGDDNQMWYIQYRTANRTASNDAGSDGAAASNVATTAANGMGAAAQVETAPAQRNSDPAADGQALGLFPNPAQTTVTVALPGGGVASSVQVSDLRGAIVAGAVYRGQGQLDVSGLPAGFYLVTASDGLRTFRHKLIKK